LATRLNARSAPSSVSSASASRAASMKRLDCAGLSTVRCWGFLVISKTTFSKGGARWEIIKPLHGLRIGIDRKPFLPVSKWQDFSGNAKLLHCMNKAGKRCGRLFEVYLPNVFGNLFRGFIQGIDLASCQEILPLHFVLRHLHRYDHAFHRNGPFNGNSSCRGLLGLGAVSCLIRQVLALCALERAIRAGVIIAAKRDPVVIRKSNSDRYRFKCASETC
jgi:hypothetical protein